MTPSALQLSALLLSKLFLRAFSSGIGGHTLSIARTPIAVASFRFTKYYLRNSKYLNILIAELLRTADAVLVVATLLIAGCIETSDDEVGSTPETWN